MAFLEYVPIFLFVLYTFILFLGHITAKYLKEKHQWVKRHWSFLDALSTDIQKVKESVEKVKKRASEFGDSELNLEGITQPLQGIEAMWLNKARNVLSEADRCVKHFESLVAMRKILDGYLFVILNLLSILDLFFVMRRTEEEINRYLKEQKTLINEFCALLEEARKKIRGLQDRPIEEIGDRLLSSRVPSSPTITALERVISTQATNLIRGELAAQLRLTVIKMKLLQAFVKDIQWLNGESEIEKAWIKEAEDVIEEADEAIKKSKQEAKIVRWPVAFGLRNLMAKRKLTECISYFDCRYSDLLEAKDRYGLRFVRSISSKHVRRCPQHKDDEAISTALDNIGKQVAQSSSGYSRELHQSISSLCKQMKDINQLLKDENDNDGARHARMACFDLLNEIASQACKCIESYKEASPSTLLIEVKQFQEAADLLHTTVRVLTIEIIEDSYSVVGLEEDVHKLVSKLTTTTNDGSVVSIVGTKGTGKTTLAKEICNHRSIRNHFKVCFVSLPHEHLQSIEARLLKNVRDQILRHTREKGLNKEICKKEIHDFLQKQACLVVLDDLRSTKAWDILKQAFPDESKSVILLTTCSWAVASHANPSNDTINIHRLRLRTGEESWDFFTQMVSFPSEDKEKGKVTSLAKKVVARTGGLPLSILRLGYLLSGKCLTESELSRLLLEREDGSQSPWSKTWDINKEAFQSDPILDKCFSYSEFFPGDFEIPSRRLVALWVASGLFRSEDSSNDRSKQQVQTPEKVAKNYLRELIERNVIQVVKRKRNGEVKTCCFPKTLREIWLYGTRKNMTRARSWSLFSSLDGQLAYRFDDKDASSGRGVHGLNSAIALPEEKYPRSIMFFDKREGNEPGEDISKFLLKGISSRRFEDLLVLDLEGVFRPHLPNSIEKLKKLTYLGLRSTYLEKLPDFIGSLQQLQTLDLKQTNVRKLPSSIWKLKRLTNLYLNQSSRIKIPHHWSSMSMKSLQRLSGVFVDHESSDFTNNLGGLKNLQKLEITIFQLPVEQQKGLVKGIAELTNIESLTLRSIDEKGKSQDLKLKSLKNVTNLSSLYLLGKLEKPAIIGDLPESLTELTLSASGLLEDPMSKLGKLPNLKFLSFLSGSYKGKIMFCSKNDFRKLMVLHMWNLFELENLIVEEEAMKNLREFEVRSCPNLRSTTGLTNLKVLQVLTLTGILADDCAIENEFAAAKEKSPYSHCPKINRNKKETGPASQSTPEPITA